MFVHNTVSQENLGKKANLGRHQLHQQFFLEGGHQGKHWQGEETARRAEEDGEPSQLTSLQPRCVFSPLQPWC